MVSEELPSGFECFVPLFEFLEANNLSDAFLKVLIWEIGAEDSFFEVDMRIGGYETY